MVLFFIYLRDRGRQEFSIIRVLPVLMSIRSIFSTVFTFFPLFCVLHVVFKPAIEYVIF